MPREKYIEIAATYFQLDSYDRICNRRIGRGIKGFGNLAIFPKNACIPV
jgi:hypothetical protein